MKRETLEKRIKENLFTASKPKSLKVKYRLLIDMLIHPSRIYPRWWTNNYGTLVDKSEPILEGLHLLGIDYTDGNDAPRGGASGYYIELTKKGKRQVRDFSKFYQEIEKNSDLRL